MRAATITLIAALVSSCGSPSVVIKDDEFSKAIRIIGVSGLSNPLIGTKAEYHLVSFVGKAEPHRVEHRIEANFYYDSDVPTQTYVAASDDTAETLPLKRLYFEGCGFKTYCMKTETVGITVADGMLRQRDQSGYRVKVAARSGDAQILNVTSAMIRRQLEAVDAAVRGADVKPNGSLRGER